VSIKYERDVVKFNQGTVLRCREEARFRKEFCDYVRRSWLAVSSGYKGGGERNLLKRWIAELYGHNQVRADNLISARRLVSRFRANRTPPCVS
jgi:hypothetical protein